MSSTTSVSVLGGKVTPRCENNIDKCDALKTLSEATAMLDGKFQPIIESAQVSLSTESAKVTPLGQEIIRGESMGSDLLTSVSSNRESSHSSPTTAEEEDKQVRLWQESGALSHVFGSQSLLSQELPKDLCEEDLVGASQTAASFADTTPDKRANSANTPTSSNPSSSPVDLQKEEDDDFCMLGSLKRPSNKPLSSLKDQKPVKTESSEKEYDEGNGYSQELSLSTTTNFGSLLEAIQKVKEQDDFNSQKEVDDIVASAERNSKSKPSRDISISTKKGKKRNKTSSTGHPFLEAETRYGEPPMKKRFCDVMAGQTGRGKSSVAPQRPKSRILVAEKPISTALVTPPSGVMAQSAADLAARTIHDPDLAKQLLLSMALCRANPRSAPDELPGPGHVLPNRFFWAHYPPLEAVLKENMAEYYQLSMNECQSVQQQLFNNRLVVLVREVADNEQWTFDPQHFSDKVLRDRIRCYYKTHIQNAKKRLKTMLRNPTKRSNAVHLMQHYDLIRKTAEVVDEEKAGISGALQPNE